MIELRPEERTSSLWAKVIAEAEQQVSALHVRLETAKSWDEVLRIQGTIIAFRAIMRLDKPPEVIPADLTEF